jgi:SnoaL-like polyketide cyclase
MALFADDARRILQNLPMRIPKPVALYLAVRNGDFQSMAKKSTIWLHKANGDEITGRTKKEIRAEIYTDDPGTADDDGADPGEMTSAEMAGALLERAEVTIEDPVSTGMPRVYLEGLSDIDFTIASHNSRHRKVAMRWELNAMHTGPLLGQPGTGREVRITGVTILKFEEIPNPEGKASFAATEEWSVWDLPSLLAQIQPAP